jgi:putative endonuclease
MSSLNNKTLYTGVTNDLERRVKEHKSGLIPGFTKKYNCIKLVYYEEYSDINEAIDREKQIKGWKRIRKEELIDTANKERNELYKE